MQNSDPKQKNRKKDRINLIIAITSVVLAPLILWLWLTPWVWYDHSPKPLGEKMEYIGKKDYGCWLGFCDAKPGATYYYATDMSLEEVEGYFEGAKVEKFSPADSFHRYSILRFTTQGTNFEIKIYTHKADEAKYIGIQEPAEKHIISIPHFKYSIAKDAL